MCDCIKLLIWCLLFVSCFVWLIHFRNWLMQLSWGWSLRFLRGHCIALIWSWLALFAFLLPRRTFGVYSNFYTHCPWWLLIVLLAFLLLHYGFKVFVMCLYHFLTSCWAWLCELFSEYFTPCCRYFGLLFLFWWAADMRLCLFYLFPFYCVYFFLFCGGLGPLKDSITLPIFWVFWF